MQRLYSIRDQAPAGLLPPLPVPSSPWTHIALDFPGLPPSDGKLPLTKLLSDKVTAVLLINIVCKLHGLPEDIRSDRAPLRTVLHLLVCLQVSTRRPNEEDEPEGGPDAALHGITVSPAVLMGGEHPRFSYVRVYKWVILQLYSTCYHI